MSKPRHYWYAHVKRTIVKYFNGELQCDSLQSAMARYAVEKALQSTESMNDGSSRLALIRMTFHAGMTIEQAAQYIPTSFRTAQRWYIDFIYKTARYMGYM